MVFSRGIPVKIDRVLVIWMIVALLKRGILSGIRQNEPFRQLAPVRPISIIIACQRKPGSN
jgi:hypothetical protein